jgi:hypothetical protein
MTERNNHMDPLMLDDEPTANPGDAGVELLTEARAPTVDEYGAAIDVIVHKPPCSVCLRKPEYDGDICECGRLWGGS